MASLSVGDTAPDFDLPLRGKETVRLAANDLVVIETCGGGGYGPPEQRSPELRARDRAEGEAS